MISIFLPNVFKSTWLNFSSFSITVTLSGLFFKIFFVKLPVPGPISRISLFFISIIGMYHDQVLAPIKSIYNFSAINITLGLPFLRISPDHGPNIKMFGKNISDSKSFLNQKYFYQTS